jgi:hypothetical protein
MVLNFVSTGKPVVGAFIRLLCLGCSIIFVVTFLIRIPQYGFYGTDQSKLESNQAPIKLEGPPENELPTLYANADARILAWTPGACFSSNANSYSVAYGIL